MVNATEKVNKVINMLDSEEVPLKDKIDWLTEQERNVRAIHAFMELHNVKGLEKYKLDSLAVIKSVMNKVRNK